MNSLTRSLKHSLVGLLASAIVAVGAAATLADSKDSQNETAGPAYVIAVVDVANPAEFLRYQESALPAILAHGGKAIVATTSVHVFEGQWPANWTVILEFPSKAEALAWYTSSTYQQAIPIRKRSTIFTNMVMAPQYHPPSSH